ncbi:RNA recognition motif (RRM) containing protein [Gregarina niphandrodes]|uniref:RNA recognition motif (RRM) containing protein n=1 Tax=Gregarina niphandrodes TaxID=110365 RepID=A0A023B8D0_GRENI|nr:RNA recognition motif (RRM) containing protein [Gregarina niphandrodes]EZG68928.1 RNA recognition motif (RRM) containing protein [Gregarina niphandrodes]|eukprot:XP_011134519.1 RNA recognition motif (RRM) containing protein [Gregarina niphandrodes]
MVRNIHYNTTDERFAAHFAKYGVLEDAAIVRERSGRSKGFGFVTFADIQAMRQCLDSALHLDGRKLFVKVAADPFSEFMVDGVPVQGRCSRRKIFVRNLGLHCDADALRAYFSHYGPIEDCAVVYGPNGVSKGFAFITYAKQDSAVRAAAEPQQTLCGRVVFVSMAKSACGAKDHNLEQFDHADRYAFANPQNAPIAQYTNAFTNAHLNAQYNNAQAAHANAQHASAQHTSAHHPDPSSSAFQSRGYKTHLSTNKTEFKAEPKNLRKAGYSPLDYSTEFPIAFPLDEEFRNHDEETINCLLKRCLKDNATRSPTPKEVDDPPASAAEDANPFRAPAEFMFNPFTSAYGQMNPFGRLEDDMEREVSKSPSGTLLRNSNTTTKNSSTLDSSLLKESLGSPSSASSDGLHFFWHPSSSGCHPSGSHLPSSGCAVDNPAVDNTALCNASSHLGTSYLEGASHSGGASRLGASQLREATAIEGWGQRFTEYACGMKDTVF